MIGSLLFSLGALLCLLNFHLSWLRYPLFRALGGVREDYRFVSGVPLVGSVLVAGAWFLWLRHAGVRPLDVAALSLVLVDTGGVHWFLIRLGAEWFKGRRARGNA